jgi:hypothetical protein
MKIIRFCVYFGAAAGTLLLIIFALWTGRSYMDIHASVKNRIESIFTELPFESFFKQTYFDYLRVTNRGHFNGVTLLTDGRLMFDRLEDIIFLIPRIDGVIGLHDYLYDRDIPFLYVRVPGKLQDNSLLPIAFSDNTMIYDGYYFMHNLNENNVDTLDLRAKMFDDGIDLTTAYFRGDHHWTAETALWAFGKIGNVLNEEYGFQLDERTWDPGQYNRIKFEGAFLGEESYAVNAFGNFEDITSVSPMFPTNITVTDIMDAYNHRVVATGSFVEVFQPKVLSEQVESFGYLDLNDVSRYFKRYDNNLTGDGKRVLLLADSMGMPIAPFFSTAFGRVDNFYLSWRTNNRIWSAINTGDYDIVIFLLSDVVIAYEDTEVFGDDRLYLGSPPN